MCVPPNDPIIECVPRVYNLSESEQICLRNLQVHVFGQWLLANALRDVR